MRKLAWRIGQIGNSEWASLLLNPLPRQSLLGQLKCVNSWLQIPQQASQEYGGRVLFGKFPGAVAVSQLPGFVHLLGTSGEKKFPPALLCYCACHNWRGCLMLVLIPVVIVLAALKMCVCMCVHVGLHMHPCR